MRSANMPLAASTALLSALVFVGAPAAAQDDDTPQIQQVEQPDLGAMIDRAARRASRGDFASAIREFKEVLEYETDVDVVWNIGNISEVADSYLDCALYFRWYLQLDPEDPEADSIRDSIAHCESRYDDPGALTFRVDGPDHAEIALNGIPIGEDTIEALPLPPGTYVVSVTAFDHEPWSDNATIVEGETTELVASPTVIVYFGGIELEVSEPGATVSVDGTVIGTSPLDSTISRAEGQYLVEVTLDGFHPWRRVIDVTRDHDAFHRARLIDVDVPLEELE